jgi:glycosyltransferase involved in cell wall biosynthesis
MWRQANLRLVPSVLHVLPHPGGGGELYVDLLNALPSYEHRKATLSAGPSPLRLLPSIARGWPQITRQAAHADLVHVHGDVSATLSRRLLRQRPGVITTHGLSRLRRVRGPVRMAFAAALCSAVASARVTICTSERERSELLELLPGALHERLTVVRNGVPAAPPIDSARRAATRTALSVADDEVLFLFAGALDESKRPLAAVAAARAVRRRGLPAVLAVAGSGPLAPAVADADGAAVRALGFRADVPLLLEAADAFVMPSIREGLSFALLEAMACGLPAIVCEGSGNPEVVGDAGLVVAVDRPDELEAALARLSEDPVLRSTLGAAARERAGWEFGLERFLEGTRRAYERALGLASPDV